MILFEIYIYVYDVHKIAAYSYRKYYPCPEELCEVQFRTMTCACHNKQDAFIYPDRKDARSITNGAMPKVARVLTWCLTCTWQYKEANHELSGVFRKLMVTFI